MKIALCFIINYDHILNKEHIWRKWIEENNDIINVYFYYKDINKIKSQWILQHTIPPSFIQETSYYHVIPAYLSLMTFATNHDKENQWFCLLTDSCCPIISPKKFRYLFYKHYEKTIMKWQKAWWNIDIHKRANLSLLPQELQLAHDPWFIMKRENVLQCLNYVNMKKDIVKTICNGGLANESLFAIILSACKQISNVISANTHITDWTRVTNPTSPHLFKDGNSLDKLFIEKSLTNKYVMFIRKIDTEFPDDILDHYIYKYSKEKDDKIVLKDPFSNKKKIKNILQILSLFIKLIIFIGPIIVIYNCFF